MAALIFDVDRLSVIYNKVLYNITYFNVKNGVKMYLSNEYISMCIPCCLIKMQLILIPLVNTMLISVDCYCKL